MKVVNINSFPSSSASKIKSRKADLKHLLACSPLKHTINSALNNLDKVIKLKHNEETILISGTKFAHLPQDTLSYQEFLDKYHLPQLSQKERRSIDAQDTTVVQHNKKVHSIYDGRFLHFVTPSRKNLFTATRLDDKGTFSRPLGDDIYHISNPKYSFYGTVAFSKLTPENGSDAAFYVPKEGVYIPSNLEYAFVGKFDDNGKPILPAELAS